jgi:hypothetical protein
MMFLHHYNVLHDLTQPRPTSFLWTKGEAVRGKQPEATEHLRQKKKSRLL